MKEHLLDLFLTIKSSFSFENSFLNHLYCIFICWDIYWEPLKKRGIDGSGLKWIKVRVLGQFHNEFREEKFLIM